MKKIAMLLLAYFVFTLNALTQSANYTPPLQIPPSLSANFADLRNNHFHSGLDYRTQYAVNKPVFSIADGYVSRINVSPGGYGLALYITHPATGHTSVYGHLNAFSKKIADFIIRKQYEAESFRLDVNLKADEMPVKRNEQIALSGNTGSSGGPHLHFEIRDTKSEEPLDALDFLGHTIKDNIPPELHGIALYPIAGRGVLNGSQSAIRLNVGTSKSGGYAAPSQTLKTWGLIGAGVKASDRMNGTSNSFGVKQINLFVDEMLVFKSRITRFSFDKSRMINSFVDFEAWRNNKSFFMKSFVEPGNKLDFYTTINNGLVDINSERDYKFRYELIDHYGNKTNYTFVVKGVKQAVPTLEKCKNYMTTSVDNSYSDTDFSLSIPKDNLYADFCFVHTRVASQRYFSDVHRVGNRPVPLHKSGMIKVGLKRVAPVENSKYGVVRIDNKGVANWVGGTYRDGAIEVAINELGERYAVDIDTILPQITPQNPEQWAVKKRIVISLKDDKSGIGSFRGEINGKFVLFTHDVKSSLYTYIFDDTRLISGQNQELKFVATDGAGNKREYRYSFFY